MVYGSEFFAAQMNEGEDLVSFLGKMERLQRLCEGTIIKISNAAFIMKVMQSLPSTWQTFCQGLRSNDKILDSYTVFKQILLDEERMRKSNSSLGRGEEAR
jgi:hypothetical protein